jgi:hypothetical protein
LVLCPADGGRETVSQSARSGGGFDHVSKHLIEGFNPFRVTTAASVGAGFVVDYEGKREFAAGLCGHLVFHSM